MRFSNVECELNTALETTNLDKSIPRELICKYAEAKRLEISNFKKTQTASSKAEKRDAKFKTILPANYSNYH